MDSERPTAEFPRRFGPRHILLKELARGGMGQICLALAGSRVCAIKTLHSDTSSPEMARRFLDEARLATQLAHPNVVYVSEAGAIEEVQYLVMEYVRGRNLHQMLQRCAERGMCMPLGLALYIAKELLRGLDYLHNVEGLQLVHRDMAPSNVLISYEGGLKIIDLGLAKWNTRLSQTSFGPVLGQLGYASPEQRLGAKVDSRSDIYSAGVILWEMVTGRPTNSAELPGKVVPWIPAPSTVAANVPRVLDDLIMTALARDPQDRYQTAQAFIAALTSHLSPEHEGNALRAFATKLFGDEMRCEAEEEAVLVAAGIQLAECSAPPRATSSATIPPITPARRKSPLLAALLAGAATIGVGGVLAYRAYRAESPVPSPGQTPRPSSAAQPAPKSATATSSTALMESAAVDGGPAPTRASEATLAAPTPEMRAHTSELLDRAETMRLRHRITEAISLAEQALGVHGDDLGAHLSLGRLYLKAGNLEQASDHFEAALKIAPDDRDAVHGIAEVKARSPRP